ncbi:MAG: VIT1/CCC1 transporter family protein [Verrucomicrobiales bacterium]
MADDWEFEVAELAEIYEKRGLEAELSCQVAGQLMRHDALSAHARDELGISEAMSARPVQAALASAATFGVGASLPLIIAVFSPLVSLVWIVSGGSLLALAALGAMSARAGGAPVGRASARVTFWGALAMALTAAVGALLGRWVSDFADLEQILRIS